MRRRKAMHHRARCTRQRLFKGLENYAIGFIVAPDNVNFYRFVSLRSCPSSIIFV